MDPLSVTASIVGLLGAAGKVAGVLGPLLSTWTDAPRLIRPIQSEVVAAKITLLALQRLLGDLSNISTSRATLIGVDDLITVFMDGVLVFSDLESLVLSLGPGNGGNGDMSLRARVKWVQKESDFAAVLTRLQGFKGSMSLILNILQWYLLRHLYES